MPAALFDTHCHYLSRIEPAALQKSLRKAREAGLVQALVCPADFAELTTLAARSRDFGLAYALGIHPFEAVRFAQTPEPMLSELQELLARHRTDARLCAVGEIGLDFSDKELLRLSAATGADAAGVRRTQTALFTAQLSAAQHCGLPVTVHAREALGAVLEVLEGFPGLTGVVHAYNGSLELARRFLALGFKLGFGGALTYEGSRKIRRVFAALPPEGWVLETDAPWMPTAQRRGTADAQAHPADIAEVLRHAALLRGLTEQEAALQARANTALLFPGLVESAFIVPEARKAPDRPDCGQTRLSRPPALR